MADDLQTLTPPKDTFTGGTAVQMATDPEGHKWQYDNEGGNWVNLDTGEAVSPKVFSQMAGRSGNAARDTMALAEAMRREEATLSPPRTGPVAPRPQAPIAPPMPPMGTTPIEPPQFRYPAEEVARVKAQKPIPSTRVPPSAAANQAYNLQAYQRAIAMGMPQKQAAAVYLPGMLTGQNKPIHVGNALINPTTGQPIYTAPPPALTPNQQRSMADREARTAILQKSTDARIKAAEEKRARELSPESKTKIELMKSEIAAIRKQAETETDPAKLSRFDNQIQDRVIGIENEYRKQSAPAAIVPPPGRTTSVSTPGGKPTTPEAKLARAKVLRAQHPDWSRQQVLDAVNQEAQ